jgi:hypothetical protein
MTVYKATLHIHVPLENDWINSVFTNISENGVHDTPYIEEEVWIDLYYVKVDPHTQQGRLIQTDVSRVKFSPEHGRWITIDMMEILVGIWLKYPNENMGLHVKVKTKSGKVIPVGVQHQDVNVSNHQF